MARILGLDIGIGSCGWAVIDSETVNPATGEVGDTRVIACGARCFDVPEEPKTKELRNKKRRQLRGQRRVMRRRAQRIAELRRLLVEHGLPGTPGPLPKGTPSGLVWKLRAEGLDRVLTPEELSRVLIHLAKHRGFKSNSRRQQANDSSDDGKMLKAVTELDRKSAGWRTVGEMLARDTAFVGRKRNSGGDYSHTLLRQRIEEETTRLLEAQRRLGNPAVTEATARKVADVAFFQRPLRSSIGMVGQCRFEPAEIRAARHAPSFERFRFLSRLNNLRLLQRGRAPAALDEEQRRRVLALIGSKQRLLFKDLRKALALPEPITFDGLPATKDPEGAGFADFTGSVKLAQALGRPGFETLLARSPDILDAAMSAIVFHETDEEVDTKLGEAGLAATDRAAIMTAIGSFAGLGGAGHISARACRNLLPHLAQGLVYSEACRLADYDHTALAEIALDKIPNPVVRKVIGETLKQVKAVFRGHGEPDLVHIEMARSLGKSVKDRTEIYRAGQERGADRERHKKEYAEAHGGREPNDEELERYELWKEQDHRCLYSGDYISPSQLVAGDNSIQVDHILPYSRSGDDSFRNKALVTARANQDKRNQTLWEWFGEGDPARWEELEIRLRTLQGLHHQKRKKLLLKSFAEREIAYRDRHLQDTRYIIRIFALLLQQHWPSLATEIGGARRIRTRAGSVTAMVRRGLGLDRYKKSGELGDRDHALDALILAWTTESLVYQLLADAKRMEETAKHRHIPSLIADQTDKERLRQLFLGAVESVFVSRPEVRRGRGPAHDATLYGFERGDEGEIQYERKAVIDLKPADLERLKGDPARTARLREALSAWLAKAERQGIKPPKLFALDPPRMPSAGGDGPVIRHVQLRRRSTQSGIKIRRGSEQPEAHADLATMVRVDVFEKGRKNYLVPVYAYQVADRDGWPDPPVRAVKGARGEEAWHVVDGSFRFRFSLYSSSLVGWPGGDGYRFGYFRALDRNTGAIKVAPHDRSDSAEQLKISPMTIAGFNKYNIDRLGSRHLIEREPREWRGEVCMSASAVG
ncbi:MAG TPA: type II CRISPR RNA-guided endonuclease Cas9 [Geminicoccaceae bacterium]|nr:type II CRISPR RNA-guided endonuclease Cas9 [Geminicoccus sp.]HMU49534.1 type II CRISPR RNA-guided endonuclease Cas9 [Geminicoccaceae bacterium]